MDRNETFKLNYESTGDVSIITDGSIPVRWFHMIKDFYWPEAQVEFGRSIDFTSEISKLSDISLNDVIHISRDNNRGHFFVDDAEWVTLRYRVAKLKECEKFSCLENISNMPYITNSWGAIRVTTNASVDYNNYIYPYRAVDIVCGGIGEKSYYTSPTVNIEELVCLNLSLKNVGVNATQIYRWEDNLVKKMI